MRSRTDQDSTRQGSTSRRSDATTSRHRWRRLKPAAAFAFLLTVAAFAATPGLAEANPFQPNAYQQTNLVADQPGNAAITDPNLVNSWGLSIGPTGALWVSDNGTDVSTLDAGANGTAPASIVPLVVKIPGGAPTGTVFNGTGQFVLKADGMPAAFLFASESGHITAWNPQLADRTLAVDVVPTQNAIYKGLTLQNTSSGPRLYATDFHNGKVDVFDGNFNPVHRFGAFFDPFLPRGFAPFGVEAVGNNVVVTYAKQDADREDDVAGAHLGFVDVYTPDGQFLRRLVSGGALNAPWGLAQAPDGFGRFSHALLVGNFGDGHINAYDPITGFPLGSLEDGHGRPITIDGLWGLKFGNGTAGRTTTLWFSSGPDDESHGLLGTIEPSMM
jgi:uncharacterized protein (TIGR03118 family)